MEKEVRSTIRTTIDCSKDGVTQQNFAQECDINYIVEKARKTGLLSHVNENTPIYGDCTNVPDYQTAFEIVKEANQAFDALDSRTRERFLNDPANMLSFISDSKNKAEAIELGLIEKPIVNAEPMITAGTEAKKANA